MKSNQICSSAYLKDVGSYLADGQFKNDVGIVKLHPTKGTHWVANIGQNFFDSHGCSIPEKLSRFMIKL